jgi:hypothetical protein
MRNRLEGYVSLGQITREANHFLRAEFSDVPGVRVRGIAGNVAKLRITGVVRDARNPHVHLWESWGRRMLRAWGYAEVSVNSLVPARPVSFQLEVYVSRDGKQIGHSGTLVSKESGAAALDGRGLSIIQLKEIAQAYLKTRFRSVRQVRITTVRESVLDGAYVYEVWGDGAAAENELVPAVLVYFQFRVFVNRDGTVTTRRASVSTR